MRLSSIGWSLFGLAAPLFFALAAIPILLERVGIERFGLLSLCWALLGYASVFDLGIGRAVTQQLATARGAGSKEREIPLVRVAIRMTARLSAVGGAALLTLALSGVYRTIETDPAVMDEIGPAIWIMAGVLPLQALSATWRGVNEAFENFRAVSLIRAFLGAGNFGLPLLVSLCTTSLVWLVMSLLLTRLVGFLLYRRSALRQLGPQSGIECSESELSELRRKLLSFGGWATVSSVISPLMVTFDRFVIAAVISASAVAVYTVPFEVVSQSLVLVGAVTTVAFPTLARMRAENPASASKMFSLWTVLVGGCMALVGGGLALIMPYVLPIWTRGQLSPESIVVGQLLCIGLVANSFGAMFYARLHSAGKSRITALIHVIELPIYLIALGSLVGYMGVVGAAVAWSGRMVLDALLLKVASRWAYV